MKGMDSKDKKEPPNNEDDALDSSPQRRENMSVLSDALKKKILPHGKKILREKPKSVGRSLKKAKIKGCVAKSPNCVIAENHDLYPAKRESRMSAFRPYDSYKALTVMSDSEEE
jgi:hypothetical protein